MTEEKRCCLTLDLEDDWSFDDPSLDHLVFDHLDDFIGLMQEVDIPISIFVVGQTLEKYPDEIDRLERELECEFHLHSYHHDLSHSVDFETDVGRGIDAFRDFFGRNPRGYRAPQGRITPTQLAELEEFGFDFDSSIFPSYRPGVYNNLDAPTEPFIPGSVSSLLEIPVGVFERPRIPTSLSYFKLVGRPLASYLAVASLPSVLVYNIHLHDLYRTASHDELSAPKRWVMKRNLQNAESILQRNLETIRDRGYHPTTMSAVYEEVAATDTTEDRRGRRTVPVKP